MKKNLSTLVEDIYQTVTDITDGKQTVPDELLNELGQKIARTIKTWSTPQHHNKFKLRMSNIGRPSRQLYYSQQDTKEIKHHPSTQLKFLYGHIMEDLLIFLVKLSNHSVTDEQKEVTVDGVLGHMDCKIDGEVIDIKTASGFGFKKFKNKTLAEDDPFGYVSQLAGYELLERTPPDQGELPCIRVRAYNAVQKVGVSGEIYCALPGIPPHRTGVFLLRGQINLSLHCVVIINALSIETVLTPRVA